MGCCNQSVQVKFKKLTETATVPEYKTAEAAGMDLSSDQEQVIKPGSFSLVKTGISIELPVGFEAQVRPRSGLAYKYGVTVLNTPGTIDSDYRGDVGVILINHGSQDFEIKKGDRIAQLVIARVSRVEMVEVEKLDESNRGTGGFGSTGK
jgi:dUTP pyrophosphatase